MNEEELYLFSEFQKEFTGSVKRAWLEKQGAGGGFLGIGKKTGDEAVRESRNRILNNVRQESGFGKIQNLNQKINAKGNIVDRGISEITDNPRYFYSPSKKLLEEDRMYYKRKVNRRLNDMRNVQKTPYGEEAMTLGRKLDVIIGG